MQFDLMDENLKAIDPREALMQTVGAAIAAAATQNALLLELSKRQLGLTVGMLDFAWSSAPEPAQGAGDAAAPAE